MYGLRNTVILAYQILKKNLKPFAYQPIPATVRMWRYKERRTRFCVTVDDFGIKYFNKDGIQHLLDVLNTNYNCTIDWSGKIYRGMYFDWDYDKGHVNVSMPN